MARDLTVVGFAKAFKTTGFSDIHPGECGVMRRKGTQVMLPIIGR